MKAPILTVVMPVYNGETYLREAIDSVLQQSFTDYEFIIINDGSIDQSLSIISSYSDRRIRIVNNFKNLGIARCRNLGLKLAKGDFLGWTDCDDLNLPTRFEEQINYLQNNPDFGGCGTWLSRFNDDKIHYVTKALKNPEEIKAALLFKPSTVPNATAVLRLNEVRKHDLLYNAKLPIGEDYEFIIKCSQHFKFSNIQKVLYKYRDSESSIMKKFEDQEKKSYAIVRPIYINVLKTLDIHPSEAELKTHYITCSRTIFENYSDFEQSYKWLTKIKSANSTKKAYDEKALNGVLSNQFFFTSKKASKFGFKTLAFFINKSLKNNWGLNPMRIAKLSVRCVLKHDKFEFIKF